MRLVMTLSLCALTSACAFTASEGVASQDTELSVSEDSLSSGDKAALRDVREALKGHTSRGSEGDPTQYKAALLPSSLTGELSVAKIAAAAGPVIPELRAVRKTTGGTYAAQAGLPMDQYWRNELTRAGSVPEQTRVVNLMNTVNAKMRNIKNVVVGVKHNGSLENGSVAPMLVGNLPSGRVVALYGIDTWT